MTDAADRAHAAYALGRDDEVERICGAGLVERPGDGELMMLLALARSRVVTGRRPRREVAALAERAVAVDPDDPWTNQAAAVVMGRCDDDKRAVAFAERAVTLDPHQGTYHAVLAERLIGWSPGVATVSGRVLDRALRHAQQAIELDPTDGVSWVVMSKVRLQRHEPEQARRSVEEGLRLDPENAVGHQVLALLADAEGDTRSASEHWVRSGRLDPRSSTPARSIRRLRKGLPVGPVGGLLVLVVVMVVLRGIDAAIAGWVVPLVVMALVVGWVAWSRAAARRELVPEAKAAIELQEPWWARWRSSRGTGSRWR